MSIKISELNVANTPLIGNEVVPIVQDGETKKVSVSSIINTYFDNGNSSINTEIDWSKATVQEINLDDDPTLTFSNESIGQRLSLLLRQGLPGQRTIIWPNGVKWNGDILPILPSVDGAGSFDNTFSIGGGFNSPVISLAIQSDSKILVGGKFTDFNGNSVNYICRLNPNGIIDNTFNIGGGFNSHVNSLSVQSDSKILVGGKFTDFNGNSGNKIVRLNSDGTIDNTFNIGTGFNSHVISLAIQSDGKILVGGNFSDYDGNSVNYICRLNPNGTIDNTFNIGGGFNSPVISLAIQSDGKILVGGNFSDYDGNVSNYITRLIAEPTPVYSTINFVYNGTNYIGYDQWSK